MTTEPTLEHRPVQHFAGIRTLTTMPNLGSAIMENHDRIYRWLGENNIEPSGPPFIRYHVIDMQGDMDVELGVPVAKPIEGNGTVKSNTLPEGDYLVTLYTGPYEDLISVTGNFLKWAGENDVHFRKSPSDKGEVWESRLEYYIKDPGNETDPNKFETELAFLTR